MINEEIIIAGFGGQGVLSMGKILSYSGLKQNLETSWFPSYGPEMRGGTANVTVILSEEPISSPIVNYYDSGVLLNQQSIDKFECTIKPGGVILYEENGVKTPPSRDDISIYSINAAEEALKLESPKTFNMIVLGAYIKIKNFISLENVTKGIGASLPQRHHHLLGQNEQAVLRGMEIVKEIQKV